MRLFRISLIILFFICQSGEGNAKNKTILWNYRQLKEIKKDVNSRLEIAKVIEYADYCLDQPYITVTEKSKSFCLNDKHYYTSIGIYWWPNDTSKDGFPYVNKDGYANPEYKEYDYIKLKQLSKRLRYLSLAYFFTKKKKFYNYYVGQVKAWFIDDDTKMYPNFEYAQVIPGRNENKGRGAGLSEAVEFNSIIESLRLINSCHRIKKSILKPVIKWFADFAEWMENSEIGKSCASGNDNIAICYDVLLLNMSILSGNTARAKEIVTHFPEVRLQRQIDEKGRFTAELKRTKAYYYSINSLSHILDFSLLSESIGYHVYASNNQAVNNSFSFLKGFVGNRELFTYNQIGDWESCEELLLFQEDKLNQLNSTKNKKEWEESKHLTPSQRLRAIINYE